jgi:hypothetical protein
LIVVFAVGCGSSGIEQTLVWDADPGSGAHSVNGSVRNTSSHSLALSPKSMRLLDADGRKV